MLRVSLAAFILSTVMLFASPSTASAASETGWLGVVVARGELKQQIEATPILERPNRPFHFYGNTVRRQYYRGSAMSRSGDGSKAAPAAR